MKTPADAPILSEYLPALRYLWHLDGANINPDLVCPVIGAFLLIPLLLVITWANAN